ncbi:LPXTG cell wall anchor domain-containing protein [Streptococcus suis]
MNAKKLVKWGVALTSALVLGGVVGPVGGNLVTTSAVVYAEDVTPYTVEYYLDGQLWGMVNYGYRRGWPYVKAVPDDLSFPNIDEIELVSSSIADPWRSTKEEIIATGGVLRYYWVRKGGVSQPVEKPVEIPAETPTDQPVEQPAEKPVETPTEKPVGQPAEKPADQPVEKPITYRIHYFLNDVVENGGTPSYTDIAPYKEGVISKGETIVEVAPHIDGYAVAGNNTIPVTYDHVTGDNVWHDEDWYPTIYFFYDKVETLKPTDPTTPPTDNQIDPVTPPTEKPVTTPTEQPVETPTEQPVEQPVKTPTEQPVEQPVETPAEQPSDQPAETPTDQPIETPADQPVDQPAETPTDKPSEQPTATSLLAGNTASKAQTVATTDKKKVDNSTSSTSPVASQDSAKTTAKPTAKSLPKTGDSGSMLLVLGGLLSGLSGLGLAATSRKRD